MTDRLFVYGTLRDRSGHPMHEVLAKAATLQGPGQICGRLYRVDWYPGLVLGDEASGERVHGDLYAVHDRPALRVLDEYEGGEYERREVSVTLPDGVTVIAFAYVYTGNVDSLDPVPGGDWLAQG